jgi:hypothetical protein
MLVKRRRSRDPLQVIPGVGPSLAGDLRLLGIREVAQLKRRDPERMYLELCRLTHERQDPCVLYVFRCAVYFARTPKPERRLLDWWAWTDARIAARSRAAGTGRTRVTA